MTSDGRQRAAGRIGRLARSGLDVAAFWRECNEVLSTAVPHYMAPCWFTFDPVSLLITSHFDPVIPEISAEFLAHEYRDDDVLKMASVARSGTGVATIHEATGGDPSRSPGWRAFVQPYGGDQQLMVTLRSKPGEPWGLLALYREAGQPEFDRNEVAFLAAVAAPLAEGARRGLLLGEAAEPDGPHSPSLIVLDEDGQVQSMTPGAEALLAAYELTDREKDVTRMVLQGETTSAAAARLFISPQTVQQHLKSIFGKTGVRSRRELVGKMFFTHYEPRVRDNERRAQTGRPFRGGPSLPDSADRPPRP
jgi:DNA-binding CsgD family transcriptional regulator